MSRVGVNQDHQIIRKSCVLDVGVLAETRGLFRPLQHPVHLGEVEVTEQRRDNPALRNALLAVGLEHDLQQVQNVHIVDPPRHLRQQPIVPDIVEIAAQVDIYDTCFLLNDRSGHTINRVMSCPLGTISKRSRLEVCLEDRLQYELERPLHHPIPNRRNRKNADFAPVLRYFLLPSRQRHIVALIQFVPNLLEEAIYASRSVSILQTWTYNPQKRQDFSAFALRYILLLRSCKFTDAFVISSLPS